MISQILRGISKAITLTIFLILVTMYFTNPNYLRSFTPNLFGLKEVSPRVYSDSNQNLDTILQLITNAEDNSKEFFGDLYADPIYIICQSKDCTKTFGKLSLGLTVGFHRVMIAHSGINASVFDHERIHVELHALMGYGDFNSNRFPMWFNEGLAEYLSLPRCPRYFNRPTEISRIKQAESFSDWRRMVADQDFGRHYASACHAVGEIVDKVGRDRLRELILAAESREQFLASLPKTITQ